MQLDYINKVQQFVFNNYNYVISILSIIKLNLYSRNKTYNNNNRIHQKLQYLIYIIFILRANTPIMSAAKQIEKKGHFTSHEKEDFLFQIKGKHNLYLKQTIQVDFTPVKAIDQTSSPQKIAQFSIIPTFNDDNKFYSYAFIMPYQGLQDDNKMLIDHETRVKQYSIEIDEHKILLPKPRHQKPYCSVCKFLYQDYLEHVKSEIHLKQLSTNKYCILTNQLIENFKNKHIQKQTKKYPKRLHQHKKT